MNFDHRIIFLLLIVFFVRCTSTPDVKPTVKSNTVVIECDAEKWEGERFVDKSGDFSLSNANGRTQEEKRSGEYALKLSKEVPYGMSIVLDSIKPDDYFQVTVWQKGNGHISASDDIPNSFYLSTNNPVETDSLGWQKLFLDFYIPHNYTSSKIKILLCDFGTEPVYFDDLKIVRQDVRTFPTFENDEVMNIYISDENYKILNQKRQDAIDEGILMTEEGDWVDAIIFYNDQVLDTKIRLKGDRLDHLQGEKWSFRVKIKGDESWKGMKTFSVQTPQARNFLYEWFFHQALVKEDLLCTRYGFVPVNINGKSLGVYAWEEHFEKQLIESRNRREGPILKLSDDSYWVMDKLRRQKEINYSVPSYDAAVITPFNSSTAAADSIMKFEFEQGRDLYYQYKYARGLASDILDVEAAAKYYAMTDATNAYHTLHFFNQRFYYNPVLGKLEPIFFDSFADVGIFDFEGEDLVIGKADEVWINVHLKLFADPKFKKLYFDYLNKYSSKAFWEDLFNQNKKEITALNELLNKEFTYYKFDVNDFYNVAQKARVSMETLKALDDREDSFSKFADRSSDINRNYWGKADFEVLPYLVNIYEKADNIFHVENFSTDTIYLVGMGENREMENLPLDKEIVLPPASSKGKYDVDFQFDLPENDFLFFRVRGEMVSIPVISGEPPNRKPKFQEIYHSFDLEALQNSKVIEKRNDSLIFSGNITLANHLVIPDGWKVIFEKGTNLDLVHGATFISYSPLFVKGTESSPVIFKSSDHTGKGINVFQVKTRSEVKNAVFTGLTNLQFGGWLTTCSVCFYEADVDFEKVKFEKNVNCDDALNVVRSHFNIKNCSFENTFADAFDSDFSTGVVSSTHFISAGNDALDFSGSHVLIENTTISDSGDKGISCGEQSQITIKECSVEGGNIGVAAKDNSEVQIDDSEIKYVNFGLVAFCKKPEYGPARIRANNLILKKYIYLHLIEEGSNLEFNNREIFGQERNLAKRFY